jgi:hypothetical protein
LAFAGFVFFALVFVLRFTAVGLERVLLGLLLLLLGLALPLFLTIPIPSFFLLMQTIAVQRNSRTFASYKPPNDQNQTIIHL